MIPSSYLKQSDFTEGGFIVTINHLKQENVAPDDKPVENKWVLFFKEFDKGLVLNTVNINAAAAATGSDDTDNWVGKEVIVHVDPSISYGGKVTGGLRIRKHSEPAAPSRREPAAADNDKPPF